MLSLLVGADIKVLVKEGLGNVLEGVLIHDLLTKLMSISVELQRALALIPMHGGSKPESKWKGKKLVQHLFQAKQIECPPCILGIPKTATQREGGCTLAHVHVYVCAFAQMCMRVLLLPSLPPQFCPANIVSVIFSTGGWGDLLHCHLSDHLEDWGAFP